MEVSVGTSRDTGIASHIGYQQEIGGKDASLILANPAGGSSVLDLQSAATLTGLAVQGPSLDINGVSLPSFGAILRAVASNNDVNVLSTPHILTTDNEEAEIVVGDNVPFVSGFVGGMGGGGAVALVMGGLGLLPTVNVQRQDVALTLKITLMLPTLSHLKSINSSKKSRALTNGWSHNVETKCEEYRGGA